MKQNAMVILRLTLLLLFLGFVAGFVVTQYEVVHSFVTILCISCIGLGG